MEKPPTLKLVPNTGKRLSEVTKVVEYNSALLMGLFGALVSADSSLLSRMIAAFASLSDLSDGDQKVIDRVIQDLRKTLAQQHVGK